MLAAIRPDAWNLPLIVHVAGAMLVVGALVVVLAATAAGVRRGDSAAVLVRLGFRALLLGVLPAYVVMRAGAEWVASEAGVGDPAWVGIGYGVADGGLLLTVIAAVRAVASAARSSRCPRCSSSRTRSRSGR